MCLWSPQFPHHNTVIVDKEEDLIPFRPIILVKQKTIVFTPYFPYYNKITVYGNTSKASNYESTGFDHEYSDEDIKAKFSDFKYQLKKVIAKQKARSDINQEKLLMVQGIVLQEINSKV